MTACILKSLSDFPFTIYYSTAMAKRETLQEIGSSAHSKRADSPTVKEGSKRQVTREYVHSLRGKFKGKGLLKALMAEKNKEREIEVRVPDA
jgi:hypothetical protein